MGGLSRADIDEIIRLVERSGFDELKLEMGDTRIEIRRNGARAVPEPSPPAETSTVASAVPAPAPSPPAASPPAPPPAAAPGEIDVPAPQLGIFYHAPKPGEAPFVAVGDHIGPHTVIGIIEVMKLMNTVEAGVSGTVVAVVAPDGVPVKQGDTLLRVRPD
jgi:acetyl-CoA carboxylase biotin carboxyl carrier protein